MIPSGRRDGDGDSERDKWSQHKRCHCKIQVVWQRDLFGYSGQPKFVFTKVPGRTFFLNLSNNIAFAAAPLVLTPFVRNQEMKMVMEREREREGRRDGEMERWRDGK